MMEKLEHAMRHHPWLSLAFVLALLLATGFAVRAIWMAVYWAGVEEKNPHLQAWMTPRYVMHTWDIKRRDLRSLLVNDEDIALYKDFTLGQIADHRQQNFAYFASQLEQQLLLLQQQDRLEQRHEHDD